MLTLLIWIGIIVFILSRLFIKSKKDPDKEEKKNNPYIIYLIIFIVILFATLPFHYVIYKGDFDVFPKENFTFSNTFLFEDDINNMIERYNNASLFEKVAIDNEPLMRKLMEKGIIVEKKRSDDNK